MTAPGKIVVDEFYVHLSALLEVKNEEVVRAVQRVATGLPRAGELEPNIAKINLRSGRVSLLAYPDFFDDPFPALAAAWVYQPGSTSPSSFRRYDDTLNPPILHRKERLISAGHPDRARWEETTKAAEAIGLFDETATIGFRLNWARLVASKGYRFVNDEFVPIGNDDTSDVVSESNESGLQVQRHLTALSRTALSAPVQLLIRYGLLSSARTLFDYGCGRGGDVAGLSAEGYDAKGWDPHFAPEAHRVEADIVNLGFVLNVIEDPAERVEALVGAFKLARKALAVGVMLYGNDTPGKPFRDGFLTSRNTFQKYFTQAEFKDYLEHVLARPAFMVGPGVAFIFASTEAEQQFSVSRYRSNCLAARLLATRVPNVRVIREPRPRKEPRPATEPKPARAPRELQPSPAEQRLAAARPVLDSLWKQALDLGRMPELEEVPDLTDVLRTVGSLGRAERLIAQHYDLTLLQSATKTRTDDLRVFMATQQFAKRPAYRRLEPRLQRDIKAFFGDYKSAQEAGLRLIVEAAEPANLLAACKDAAARGHGWLDGEHSLQLHLSMVERLPAVLRGYVTCGLILWDSLTDVQLVKIHVGSGKLTFMEFDGFDECPIPMLRRRIKVHVRRLNYEVFEYGSAAFPKPALYRKSRFLNEDYPGYAEQLVFDEALERHGLIPADDHGPSPDRLSALLEEKRLAIRGACLIRSESIPDLDSRCGANFRYRDFIECGETQKRLGVQNVPLRAETYNALFDLATELLDPLIDYFGSIRLTYGFASAGLTKHIAHGIAPRLDQHAACEHSTRRTPVCERGGAACDFIVEDEDMKEVANWIVRCLPFDRLYYYGPERPVHVSYSRTPAGEAFSMVPSRTGKLIPRPFVTAEAASEGGGATWSGT
jgi:DNA phosphorothioation-associated putative methyltransferase